MPVHSARALGSDAHANARALVRSTARVDGRGMRAGRRGIAAAAQAVPDPRRFPSEEGRPGVCLSLPRVELLPAAHAKECGEATSGSREALVGSMPLQQRNIREKSGSRMRPVGAAGSALCGEWTREFLSCLGLVAALRASVDGQGAAVVSGATMHWPQ